jgi:hypothetical protein
MASRPQGSLSTFVPEILQTHGAFIHSASGTWVAPIPCAFLQRVGIPDCRSNPVCLRRRVNLSFAAGAFSRPLRDGVRFLGMAPGVETPGYYQNVLRTLRLPEWLGLYVMRVDVCVRRTPDNSPAFQRRVGSGIRTRTP